MIFSQRYSASLKFNRVFSKAVQDSCVKLVSVKLKSLGWKILVTRFLSPQIFKCFIRMTVAGLRKYLNYAFLKQFARIFGFTL